MSLDEIRAVTRSGQDGRFGRLTDQIIARTRHDLNAHAARLQATVDRLRSKQDETPGMREQLDQIQRALNDAGKE